MHRFGQSVPDILMGSILRPPSKELRIGHPSVNKNLLQGMLVVQIVLKILLQIGKGVHFWPVIFSSIPKYSSARHLFFCNSKEVKWLKWTLQDTIAVDSCIMKHLPDMNQYKLVCVLW